MDLGFVDFKSRGAEAVGSRVRASPKLHRSWKEAKGTPPQNRIGVNGRLKESRI